MTVVAQALRRRLAHTQMHMVSKFAKGYIKVNSSAKMLYYRSVRGVVYPAARLANAPSQRPRMLDKLRPSYKMYLSASCLSFLTSTSPSNHSSFGILNHASIAALNAAKPAHPMAMAWGPPFLASTPPVRQPAAMPLVMSFFALNPSIPHSMPLNNAPTVPKPFAVDQDRLPMSRKPEASCFRSGKEDRGTLVFWPDTEVAVA
jgi:hypothetical protein